MNTGSRMRLGALALVGLLALAIAAPPATAQLSAAQTWGGTAGGTSTAPTLAIHNVVALNDLLGVPIRFLPNGVNNGASTLTISLDSGGTLGPTAIKKPGPSGLAALTGCELKTAQESTVVYDGTQFVITSVYSSSNPTYTYLTAGTGTYTPATCITAIDVEMVGPGGGGGGAGTPASTGLSGGLGTTSVFGSRSAASGSFGQGGGATIGIGGIGGAGGGGAATYRWPGSGGGYGLPFFSGFGAPGGMGGASCRGGGGSPTSGSGTPGGVNSGGGGGGGTSATIGSLGGGGGGAGECVGFTIQNPGAINYTVGVGGTAGPAGTGSPGGVGADGGILITERYNFLLRRDLAPAANDNSPMWLDAAA